MKAPDITEMSSNNARNEERYINGVLLLRISPKTKERRLLL